MTHKFDAKTLGAPAEGVEHRHHRARAAASLVAAAAGGVAALLVAILGIAGVGPAETTWAWIGLAALALVWLSGLWWRWDSPDRRSPTGERERRGF